MKKIEERIKMTREDIQEKALQLSLENPYMVLQYPTGLGKTYTMIKMIERVLNQNSSYDCLILEEEISVIDNIKKEFEKFGKDYLLDRCNIICYKSLKKIEKYYPIIVLDEAHHAFSELRLDWFSNAMIPKYMYLLSATLETGQIKQFEKVVCAEFLVHRITLKKAIEWGILPTPKIGIFPLKLNEKDINCYYEYKRGEEELQKEVILQREVDKWKYIKNKNLYPNIHLIIYCTEKQKYDQLCYEAEMAKARWEKNKNERTEKWWLYSELCIKRFLSEIKTPYLDEFLQDVIDDGNKFICFFGSVSQAEELAKKHNANLVAAKNKESHDLIKKFNNDEISNLYCCRMLSEGITLSNLDMGIIAQLDGKANNFIQRCGRVLRNQDRPYLYIFYYQDTKDAEYLEGALKKVNKDYITYLDYFLK
jgi:superfamily II DNA or RNA helicase